MRHRRLVIATPLVALGLLTAGAPAAMAATLDPKATRTATAPVQVLRQDRETPLANGGTSYYCAVGVFIPFGDLPGWRPLSASFLRNGAPASVRIGDPPYSDGAAINDLPFAPVGARHHVQYGTFSYAQGGTLSVYDNCARAVANNEDRLSDTATVTYERTPACATAIDRLLAARKAVTQATKRVRRSKGRARAAAVAALKKAKARRTAATKVYTRRCR